MYKQCIIVRNCSQHWLWVEIIFHNLVGFRDLRTVLFVLETDCLWYRIATCYSSAFSKTCINFMKDKLVKIKSVVTIKFFCFDRFLPKPAFTDFFGHLRAAPQAINTTGILTPSKVGMTNALANSCIFIHPAETD